jgi:HD-GYP domain-containing protein (c-di-GMP phosphodiesterase class II)
MRFRTRAFLLCFVPFAVLLTISFAMTQKLVQNTVREGLRERLRENHLAVARVRSKSQLQNSRFLRVVGENAALKAGMQLLLYQPESVAARRTVEDQLRELCQQMGFDFLMISSPWGTPTAGVERSGNRLIPVNTANTENTQGELLSLDGRTFQIASVPIELAGERLGSLSVGEFFDFSDFATPAVLMRGNKVIQSGIPNMPVAELESALRVCSGKTECDVQLRGVNYLSLPMETLSPGRGFLLRSLQNVDSATGPVHAVLQRVFFSAGVLAVLVALLCGVATSSSIGGPLAAVVRQLRETERTGVLPEFKMAHSPVQEIRELTESFNRAAVATREARNNLEHAYLEFVASLANALDARDPYTAGHSRRVSELSCMTGVAMGLERQDVQRIQIGALLHDIGKIGISDPVLRKPGRLTEDEFALVREHPVIGRRILEEVQGFAEFLPAVELHHENWDGTGYPHGQRGEETPVEARIIHVADAYDAMTTDRPYRRGMRHHEAVRILRSQKSKQFDPEIVEIFAGLESHMGDAEPKEFEDAVAAI